MSDIWTPIGGWNPTFTDKDKHYCSLIFYKLKNKKGYKEHIAAILAQMYIYKQKMPGLIYSEEQEHALRKALLCR
jgi:hypothetical protein